MARGERNHLLQLRPEHHHRPRRHVFGNRLLHRNDFGSRHCPHAFVQKCSGSILRIAASSAGSGSGVVVRSPATRRVQPVLLSTSSTVTPGCTEAKNASPSSTKRST